MNITAYICSIYANELISDRKQLAALLENHALSVESAALYCRHTKKHVKQYIQLWNNSDPKIFETSEMVPTLTKTVALAVENLTSQARGLLLQCAFLDSRCIWPELFPGMSLEIYESLVTELGAISLLEIASTQEAGDNSIAVHPAVHKIVRLIAIERDDVGDCIAIVINNIAQAIPSAHDENVSDKQRLILPHVAQCRSNLQLFTEYEDLYINPVILPALGRLGWMLYQRGQLQDAEAFYSMALETYDVIFTADVTAPNTEVLADLGGSQTLPVISSMIYKDADYYDIVNSYGLLYKARGEVENAKRCFEMVRKSSDEASPLGDDLSRPALDVNLALSMRQGGRLHEARELLERARKAYEDADDEQSRYQLCKVHQYLGSVYKMEGEYWKAAEAIRRNVCAELSSIDVDPTSLPLAIANKELGSIYLLEDGKGSLAKAAKCFEDARVGIEKHCMKDSSIAIDLRWHQLMLRMAEARRMQADRDIFIQETCEAFNVFIKDLTRWRRNEPVTLHAIRTYGKSLMKLGRWEEGGDYLMRAIAGYKKRKDHPLDAAFAKKDLADGYLRQFDLSEHALNPGHLDEAKRYYLEAMNLFATICSPYAESFMSTIVERIEAIEKRTNQSIQLQQRFPALPPTSNLGRMETQMTPPTSPVHSLQNVNNIRTDANIGSTHAQSQGELRFAWIWKWIG
jgi:tetratricopeptide (TPR) repeat protein